MKDKLLKLVFSKWFLLIGIVCIVLIVMPLNSPIHLPFPDYTKPFVAMVAILCVFELFFVKHDKTTSDDKVKRGNDK